MLLVHTIDESGTIFIRTDQLDGETDWKSRKALPHTQKVENIAELKSSSVFTVCNPPNKKIDDFKGYY